MSILRYPVWYKVGKNPIKLERAFELISIPGTITSADGTYYLNVDKNNTDTLKDTLGNDTIQCSPAVTADIVAVSYLFASQSTNTNGNDTFIVSRGRRLIYRWTYSVPSSCDNGRQPVLSNFFY